MIYKQTTIVPGVVIGQYVEERDLPPTETEWKILRQMRQLRANRKSCMIVVRFDGTAWQMLEARPTGRWPE